MLTIVLDTNILVGAFLTPHGESWEVVRQAKGHKLCLSPFILTEVWRTLRAPRLKKKYCYSDAELAQYVQHLRSIRVYHAGCRECRQKNSECGRIV